MQEPCHPPQAADFRGVSRPALSRRTKLERGAHPRASPRSAPRGPVRRPRQPRAARCHLVNYPLSPIPYPLAIAFDPRLIDDLARRLAGAVPESVLALRRDLEQNFKGVLQSRLAELDLVNREEFDVQATVLRRTREKLEALEARLAELENQR